MPAAALSSPVIHRFFFALKPDIVTARRTYAFAQAELGGKGLLRPERHHVTLGLTEDIAEVPAALVERLLRAGEAVCAPPFALVLDCLSTGYGTVALTPASIPQPLRDLQAGISHAMAAEGLAMRKKWTFHPHETLCYRSAPTASERRVTGFRWAVSDFVLVHSYVGLHRHETIGRWPLRTPADPQGLLL